MHTDEYELSLSRELTVCRSTIKRIRTTLALLEQKHNRTTDAFIEEISKGTLPIAPDLKDDYEVWQSSYDSLKKWEALENQYIAVYNSLKI